MLACTREPVPSEAKPGDAALGAADADDGGGSSVAEQDATEAAEGPKHYRVVVQTGDSMVGGGLCKALAPRFQEDGTKFVRDVWEAASITAFDNSTRLPELMKKHDPDLVLLTLGSNDVFDNAPESLARHIESIVKKVGNRDCYWVGPPLWKGDKGLVDVIREHAPPCKFFDASNLKIQRAGDGIHPTEKGGEVWAERFWSFFRGEGAFGG